MYWDPALSTYVPVTSSGAPVAAAIPQPTPETPINEATNDKPSEPANKSTPAKPSAPKTAAQIAKVSLIFQSKKSFEYFNRKFELKLIQKNPTPIIKNK